VSDDINSVIEELGRIDVRIAQIEANITSLKQKFPVPSDYLSSKWYLDYRQEEDPLIQRANYLRGVINNDLLKSLDESSKRLEAASKAQTAITTNLERAERQLGAISAALLLLTGILAVFAAGSFAMQAFANIGYSGQTLNDWAFLLEMIVAGIVGFGLFRVSKIYRKPTKVNSETNPPSS
jgi:hypothetical protein